MINSRLSLITNLTKIWAKLKFRSVSICSFYDNSYNLFYLFQIEVFKVIEKEWFNSIGVKNYLRNMMLNIHDHQYK